MAWFGKLSVSGAGGSEPSCGTAALANLMLKVTQHWSFHAPCMENLMSQHILPWGWGGRGTDTTFLTSLGAVLSFWGFPAWCTVSGHLSMQWALPDDSRGCNFNWCQFCIAVRSVLSPGCSLSWSLKTGRV